MEKVALVVRKAVEDDIPQIQQVSKEAFGLYTEEAGITSIVGELNETYEDLKMEIQNKLVFVAVLDEMIVGSVRVQIHQDGTAYLSRFGVNGEMQKNGIGQALMKAVDEEMSKLRVSRLYLHTASRMLSLVRFYYGKGYYIESTSKDRGYIRALLCKEYEVEDFYGFLNTECENLAIV